MAKVSNTDIYNYDNFLDARDFLLGTDWNNARKTKSFKLENLRHFILQGLDPSNNGFVTTTGYTLVDNVLTINAGWQWQINGMLFTNEEDIVLTLEYTADGFVRIDSIYANSNNEFLLIYGEESETIAVPPLIPINTLLAFSINIFDNEIGDSSQPILGSTYQKKQFDYLQTYTGTGTDVVIPLNTTGRSHIQLKGTMTSVAGLSFADLVANPVNAEYPHYGKRYLFFNDSGHDIVLKHLAATEDIFFTFKEETDLVFPNGEFIEFYNGSNVFINVFRSWQDISNKLDKVTTVDVEKVYIKNADGTQGMKPVSELLSEILITNASVTGTYNIDYSAGDVWDLTLTGNTTLTESNAPASGTTKTITLEVSGNHALTYPSGWTNGITGEYKGTATRKWYSNKHPLYLDLSLHAKTNGYAESQKVITDVTRIDDFTLEVPPIDIAGFDNADLFFPLVIKTPTNYITVTGVVTDKQNGIISTREELPLIIEEISTFFVDGQHLSRYGYKSLAEYVADSIQKYSYRKNISFKVYAENCKPYEQNWIDATTSDVVITATKVSGTPSGGFLIPNELPYQCEMSSNVSADQSGTFFKKAYSIYQNVVGYGTVFSGFTNDSEGFCKIVVGEYLPYNVGALKIECKDQDDNVFFTKNVTGTTQEVIVPLAYQTTAFTISFTVVTAVVTAWKISLIEIHRSYQSDTNDIINKDCTIAFLCDSWGSYPQVISGETLPLRADGTTADGMQFLSSHMKYYLHTKGINATTYNNSFGGRTSAWTRYWLERLVLNLPTKPDYCVIDFLINDANSESFAIANTDSVYDFSPTDPYTLQVKSLGGVKGSVTREEYMNNMNIIIQTLLDNDIQPIVLHNHRLDGASFGIIEFNTLMLNSAQGDLKNLVTFKDTATLNTITIQTFGSKRKVLIVQPT